MKLWNNKDSNNWHKAMESMIRQHMKTYLSSSII
jgi:hypothetical protein